MPYAVRDARGRICSLHRHDPGVGQALAGDDPEVLAFLGLAGEGVGGPAAAGGGEGFDRLDADFIRVLEDLIDTLLARNVIAITDLPDIAQTKLFARKSFRDRWPRHALDLFRPGDLGGLV